MAYTPYAISKMNERGKALLDPNKAKPPTPTPAKPTLNGATTLGVGGSRASEYPAYNGKVSDSYVPGSLGNQKVGGNTSSGGSSGGGTTSTNPPLTPDPPIPPTGGDTGGFTASDYYQKMLDEQQKAIQARINAAVERNNAYIPQVNQRSDQSLQNAYILREQSKVNAPQALSAMGIQGGAAESSLLGINTGYENTRNEVEQNRSQSLDEIYQNEQQIRATGDATLSEASADYYNKLVLAQQQAEAAAQDQMQWQANYDLDAKQYEDAAAQQAWQNAYDERLLGLKQQSSGGSKVATGGAAPEADKNISGNYSVVLNNVKRALGGSNAGSSTSWDAAINYIQNSLRQNMITEYEARQMISQLGLE
jgi:hypothetical protein